MARYRLTVTDVDDGTYRLRFLWDPAVDLVLEPDLSEPAGEQPGGRGGRPGEVGRDRRELRAGLVNADADPKSPQGPAMVSRGAALAEVVLKEAETAWPSSRSGRSKPVTVGCQAFMTVSASNERLRCSPR